MIPKNHARIEGRRGFPRYRAWCIDCPAGRFILLDSIEAFNRWADLHRCAFHGEASDG